jgi:2-haloacid dehalogenase
MVKAVVFDVFGTLVDWRGSVAAGLAAFGAGRGFAADWVGLTDAWRGAYKPAMDAVRQGRRDWTTLDELHRGALADLAPKFGLALTDADLDELVGLWHRLTPWPDSVAGLTALKRRFVIGSLSNGHVALQVNLAKHTGFPWDMIFASDMFRHFKPDADVYLGACRFLGLPPEQVMLAAAHNDDLAAARSFGLRTAFVVRPMEYGAPDERARPASDWDFVSDSVVDLAAQLGAQTQQYVSNTVNCVA